MPANKAVEAESPAGRQAAGTSIERLHPALDAVIPPGAVIEKIAGGFGFVEGPLWINGELRYSDLTGNKLYAIGDGGEPRLLVDRSGGLDSPPKGASKVHARLWPGIENALTDPASFVFAVGMRVVGAAAWLIVDPGEVLAVEDGPELLKMRPRTHQADFVSARKRLHQKN